MSRPPAPPPALPCPCGGTVTAWGDARRGVLTLRHGGHRRALDLYAAGLLRRVVAGDASVLGEAPIRGWLAWHHRGGQAG